MNKPTVILGASGKPDRYANKAQLLLKEYGHTTIPVNPTESEILGDMVVPNLAAVKDKVHTVTLYVRPDRLKPMFDELIAIHPKRVIFNPGTEDGELRSKISSAGIETLEACTLVLLRNNQY